MSPRTRNLVAVLVIVLAIAGGFTAGYEFHAGPTSTAGPTTLTILAAGSLAPVLPPIASRFANATPGVSAPSAAETFTGSIAAMSDIASLGQAYDVAIVADYRLIPQMLEPKNAQWEIMFAADPVVLAYDPSVAALSGANSTDWGEKLVASGGALGVSNASTDPLGYAEIFVLQLEGSLEEGNASTLYGHFYSGSVGAHASPRSSATRTAPESQASVLIGQHLVAAYLVYQSYAVSSRLTYLPLDPRVNLGSTSLSAVSEYAQASTTISTSSGTEVVHGSAVLFSVTVPSNAPDPVLGELFTAYLVAPATAPQLLAAGFLPLSPVWVDHPSQLPAALSAGTSSPPSSFPLSG